jgi:hypothetical protein
MNIFITYYTRCWEKDDKIVSNSQGVHGVGMMFWIEFCFFAPGQASDSDLSTYASCVARITAIP